MNLFALFKIKKNRIIFIILFLVVTLFYFIFKNIYLAWQVFSLSIFSLSEKINLFFIAIFDISELKSVPMLALVFLFVFSISLFILLSYLLFKETRKIGVRRGALNTLWLFISVLGLSCAACGIGLLASLLSFFGVSFLAASFPLQGLELGYIGVIALNISNYFLLKRLKNPFTC